MKTENLEVLDSVFTERVLKMKNNVGSNFLHIAVIMESVKLVEFLLVKGIFPDEKNEVGFTPLHYALTRRNLSIIRALLEGGANPDELDIQGMSPKMYARMYCFKEAEELFEQFEKGNSLQFFVQNEFSQRTN